MGSMTQEIITENKFCVSECFWFSDYLFIWATGTGLIHSLTHTHCKGLQS